jgi:site-specific recombinase XerD
MDRAVLAQSWIKDAWSSMTSWSLRPCVADYSSGQRSANTLQESANEFEAVRDAWQKELRETPRPAGRFYSERTVEDYGFYVTAVNRDIVPLLSADPEAVLLALKAWRMKQNPLIHRGQTSGSRIRGIIAALRSFFAYAQRTGAATANPALELVTPGSKKTLPRPLQPAEVDQLFVGLTSTTEKALAWLYYLSLRNEEACRLETRHMVLDQKEGVLVLQFSGKGDKEAIVPLNLEASDALARHLLEQYWPARLLTSFDAASRLVALDEQLARLEEGDGSLVVFKTESGRPLRRRDVSRIWSDLRKRVGLAGKFKPHALRHTFATEMLEQGEDIRTVQEMMRHESIKTTAIYTQVTRGKRSQAVRKLRVPQGAST